MTFLDAQRWMRLPASELAAYLRDFTLQAQKSLFPSAREKTTAVELSEVAGRQIPRYVNEFWTAKQRQAASVHEISYRACFKPQLPRFFIQLLTRPGDAVYDPFSGRGTTAVEAGLLGRRVVANDINPLSEILASPRLHLPDAGEVQRRLGEISSRGPGGGEIDLSMFFHPRTEAEILSLRQYLGERRDSGREDPVDRWIRMVATNRLTGHSKGFFSVYTLPPNQAVTAAKQKEINRRLGQQPEYRDTRAIILGKTRSLTRGLTQREREALGDAGRTALFLTRDARNTPEIPEETVQLTVTSPPFLNVVDYSADNWLRCWFNGIDLERVSGAVTDTGSLGRWCEVMGGVFAELQRITRPGGWVAFEVGEVRKGNVRLEEHVVPLGLGQGFQCEGILINAQRFTKTANIWGVRNNERGTNTNRIVLFRKEG
jgi:hypothetical protein